MVAFLKETSYYCMLPFRQQKGVHVTHVCASSCWCWVVIAWTWASNFWNCSFFMAYCLKTLRLSSMTMSVSNCSIELTSVSVISTCWGWEEKNSWKVNLWTSIIHKILWEIQFELILHISSVESQQGINAVQWCSVENQKGAIAIDCMYSDSALLVLNGTTLNIANALLALNWRYMALSK